MPLEKKHIFTSLARGVDAGGNDPLVVQGDNLIVENAIFPRGGIIGKRNGSKSTSNTVGSTSANGAFIADFNDLPCTFYTEHNSLVSDTKDTTNSFSSEPVGGRNFAVDIETTIIGGRKDTNGFDMPFAWTEMTGNDNYFAVAIAGEESSGSANTRTTFVSYYKGSMVEEDYFYNTTSGGHVVGRVCTTANSNIVAVYFDGGALKYRVLQSNGLWGSAVTITPLTYAVQVTHLAICALDTSATDEVAICYESSGNQVVAIVVDCDGVTAAPAGEYTSATASNLDSLACCKWENSTTNFAVFWASGTTLAAVALDNTATQAYGAPVSQTATKSIKHIGCIANVDGNTTHQVNIRITGKNSNEDSYAEQNTLTESGGSLTLSSLSATRGGFGYNHVTSLMRNHGDNSDRLYWMEYHQGGGWWKSSIPDIDKATSQRSYLLVHNNSSLGELTTVGQTLQGTAGHNLASFPAPAKDFFDYSALAVPYVESASIKYVSVLKYISADEIQYGIAKIDLDATEIIPRSIGNSVLIPGSVPVIWYPGHYSEQSALEYPEGITVASGGSSGTWSRTGFVSFRVVYEKVLPSGRRVQSVPSPVVQFEITATTQQPQLTIPEPKYWHQGDYKIIVYMTDIDGQVFYRKESIALAGGATVTSTAYANSDDLFDTGNGSIVPLVEVLYTSGNVLSNAPPPPHEISAIYQNRLFCVERDNRNFLIRYSRQMGRFDAVPHSDFLEVRVPEEGGEITALEAYDEKLIIFKERAIYVLSGQGPDDTGGGTSYPEPRRISSTTGCKKRKSVTEIPQGLMFQSMNGIKLLAHDESIVDIGDKVDYHTGLYDVACATTHPDKSIALFGLSGGDTLVYDYDYGNWCTWDTTYNDIKDIKSVNGDLWFLFSVSQNTYITPATTNTWTDLGSTTYNFKIETGWFSFSDLLGEFQLYRVLLLGYNIGDANITVQHQFNFDPHWQPTTASDTQLDLATFTQFDHTSFLGSGENSAHIDSAMILQVRAPRRKLKSVRFRITDAASTSGGSLAQGFEIAGMVFVVGVRKQAALIGSTRKLT